MRPSPNGSNGRDGRGRFAPGNAGGPGNPFAGRVARLRSLLLDAISEDELRAIVEAVAKKAKGGDLTAAKMVLDYCVGKPAAAVDVDKIELQAAKLQRELSEVQMEADAEAYLNEVLNF